MRDCELVRDRIDSEVENLRLAARLIIAELKMSQKGVRRCTAESPHGIRRGRSGVIECCSEFPRLSFYSPLTFTSS